MEVDFQQTDIGYQIEDEDWRTDPERGSAIRGEYFPNVDHISQFSLTAADFPEFARRPSLWNEGSQKVLAVLQLPDTPSMQALIQAIFVDMVESDPNWTILGEIVRQRKQIAPGTLGLGYAILTNRFRRLGVVLPPMETLL